MKRTGNRSLLLYSLLPLVIYEMIFVLFVVYYSQQDITWFRAAYIGTCIAFIISFIKILITYRNWQHAVPGKLSQTVGLVCYFTSLVVYILCLFILVEGWNNPISPPIIIFILLSIPPVIEFIIFLSVDKSWEMVTPLQVCVNNSSNRITNTHKGPIEKLNCINFEWFFKLKVDLLYVYII